jgi:hypothetical protein
MDVGIGEDAFADTVRAATIVEGLQTLSALPLDTVVVPIKDALASSTPAVVISADGWDSDGIVLPVGSGADSTLDVQRFADGGEATTLQLDPGQQIASLQTVGDKGRPVLVATSNGAAAELDSLLNWFDESRSRWSRLSGTAVVAVPDREPVAVGTSTPQSTQPAREETRPWLWPAIGAAAVVAVLAAALLVARRRRRRAAVS